LLDGNLVAAEAFYDQAMVVDRCQWTNQLCSD
jgi:hypothetical protein